MKSLLLFAAFLLITVTANAQIKKSAVLLGGEFQYLRTSADNVGMHEFSESGRIKLSAGRAFTENTVIGLSLGYIPLKHKGYFAGGDSSERTDDRISIGAFYREYRPLVKNLYFFGQVDAEGFFGTYKMAFPDADRNLESRQKGGSLSLSAGISYQLFKKVQLEVSVPNLLNVQYLVRTGEPLPGQSAESKHTQFLASSALSNFTIGFLTGGLRIIL